MSNLPTNSEVKLPNQKARHKLFGSVAPGPKNKPTEKKFMIDIQSEKQDYLFQIDAVGISNVKYPIIVSSKLNPTTQTTIGTFSLTGQLDRYTKGTNMSRFLEQLENVNNNGVEINPSSLKSIAHQLKARLEQEKVQLKVSFPWFYEQKAPATSKTGLNHATVGLEIDYVSDENYEITGHLSAYVTTLCPCSKEISEYSAHSQRGEVTMDVLFTKDFTDDAIDWKMHLLHAAEASGSAKIHPLLKRPDEKVVTEQAYENPRFVEDVARLVAANLYELDIVEAFTIICRNEESIHLHDAIATIKFDKRSHV